MGRNPIETVMGAVVLVVAGLFLAFAYDSADLTPVDGYPVSAQFNKVGGLKPGSDVRISGIKVGTVTAESIDPATYRAIVTMSLLPEIQVPTDTVASIASDGLLGGKYVELRPGRATDMLTSGSALSNTRDYQSVEDMVSELIFLTTQPASGGSSAAGGQSMPEMQ